MEWNVKNARNRDVEREHLNKILKEIKSAVSSGGGLTEEEVRAIVQGMLPSTSRPQQPSTTVVLEGDVTGTGTGKGSIVVNTSLAGDYVEEAPADTTAYVRKDEAWSQFYQEWLVTFMEWVVAGDNIQIEQDEFGLIQISSTSSGGVLPVVTGEILDGQPVFVYADDGSLIYTEI